MTGATYDGPALDGSMQPISEAPYWSDGETVNVVDDEEVGEVRAENVPVPNDGVERPDVSGQSTWSDWEGSA